MITTKYISQLKLLKLKVQKIFKTPIENHIPKEIYLKEQNQTKHEHQETKIPLRAK